MGKRKVVVFIATSADGFIARPDGDIAWLNRSRTAGDYGMAAFYRTIDAILWGRTTYDEAVARGMSPSGFGGKVANYVFTHHPPATAPPAVTFVSRGVRGFVKRLRATPGKRIWVMGGSKLIGSLLDVGAIDEFIIFVIPVLIGAGIPLIAPRRRQLGLRLLSTRRYRDGVTRLHYRVVGRR